MRASGKNLFCGSGFDCPRFPSIIRRASSLVKIRAYPRRLGAGGDFSNTANQSAFGAIMNATRCCKRWGMLLVLACVVFACLPTLALPPHAIVLHSGWRFRALPLQAPNDSVHAGVEQWHDAVVPGVVQMDLLRHKFIPDPFNRDNEKSLQWVGLTDWEYQTEFDVDGATLAREHLDLLFGGLDTFADVYLNYAELLTA